MGMSREQAVRLLLLSMNDYLPTARGATSLLASVPGAGESLYRPCEDCARTGRVVGEGRAVRACQVCKAGKTQHPTGLECRPCDSCEGAGDKRGRSKEPFDAYTGKRLAELDRETVNARTETKRRRFIIETQPDFAEEDGWLRERERYWAHGSYAELYKALDWLRVKHTLRYETVMHWVASQDDDFWVWSDLALAAVGESIRMLASRMPFGTKVPGWVVKRFKEQQRAATSG